MTLLVIQLVNMVLWVVQPDVGSGPVNIALNYWGVINEMFNVIIRSFHFYSLCFTEIFTWLGNHTNNNFGSGVNEIVLRWRRILEGNCRKSMF